MSDTMKKLITRTFVAILTLCVLWYTGNPVSWIEARIKIAQHLENNYGPGYTFDCHYMWFGHTKGYTGTASKKYSKDDNFHVYYFNDGTTKDNRRTYVTSGLKTSYRISDEYKALVKPILEQMAGLHIHDAHFYKMPEEMFVVDKEYDITSLAAEYGTLVLSFEEKDGSMSEYADKLLEIKQLCDDNKITFAYIDLDAVKNNRYVGGVSFDGIPYSFIYAENLVDRLYLNK